MMETIKDLEALSSPDDPEDPLAAGLSDVVRAMRLRLNLYAAHLGEPAGAAAVASWSAGFAVARIGRAAFWPMAVASLAWAERSSIAHPVALSTNSAPKAPDVDDVLTEPVASRLDQLAAGLARALATVAVERDDCAESEARSFAGLWGRALAMPPETRRAAMARADAAARVSDTSAEELGHRRAFDRGGQDDRRAGDAGGVPGDGRQAGAASVHR